MRTQLEPANTSELTSILTYHVVPGACTCSDLRPARSSSVKAVNGATLTVSENGGQVGSTDGKGDVLHVTVATSRASDGVVRVIDGVLMALAS